MNAAAIPSFRFCGLPPITTPKTIAVLTAAALFAIAGVCLGALVLNGQGTLLGVIGTMGNKAAIALVTIGGSSLAIEFCVSLYCCHKQRQMQEWVFLEAEEEKGAETDFADLCNEARTLFEKVKDAFPEKRLKVRLPAPDRARHSYTKKHAENYLFTPVYALARSAKEKMTIQLDVALRKGFKDLSFDDFHISSSDLSAFWDNSIEDEHVGMARALDSSSIEEAHFKTLSFEHAGKTKEAQFALLISDHVNEKAAAQYLAKELPESLKERLHKNHLDEATIANAITSCFIDIHHKLVSKEVGTTATCLLILEDQIYIAHCGMSRAVLVKGKIAYALTEDAKPSASRFSHTILRNMGGQIVDNKISGILPTARALGSSHVSPRPKITQILKEDAEDDFENMRIYYGNGDYLILASVGFWRVTNVGSVYVAIQWMKSKGLSAKEMATQLVSFAMEQNNNDNVTVMIIEL